MFNVFTGSTSPFISTCTVYVNSKMQWRQHKMKQLPGYFICHVQPKANKAFHWKSFSLKARVLRKTSVSFILSCHQMVYM